MYPKAIKSQCSFSDFCQGIVALFNWFPSFPHFLHPPPPPHHYYLEGGCFKQTNHEGENEWIYNDWAVDFFLLVNLYFSHFHSIFSFILKTLGCHQIFPSRKCYTGSCIAMTYIGLIWQAPKAIKIPSGDSSLNSCDNDDLQSYPFVGGIIVPKNKWKI